LRFTASILSCFLNGLLVFLSVYLLLDGTVSWFVTVCLSAYLTLSIILIPGSYHRDGTPTRVQETINVTKVTYHSGFNFTIGKHDVALLQLARPITPSILVNTVCLPQSSRDKISPGTNCTITGKVIVPSLYSLAFCFDSE